MSDLTFRDVLNILRLIESGPFAELQVEYEGTKLKVVRAAGATATGARSAAPRPAQSATKSGSPGSDASSQGGHQKAPAQHSSPRSPSTDISNGIEVKPPMAGTFYAAPSPNAAPFIEVDRTVKKGDQLGIVEVMKLFTPVVAPSEGIVRAILVGNEEPVQRDQTLMIIEAAPSC